MSGIEDEDELELEPVDPEILEHQRARAERQVRAVEDRLDVDQLLQESEPPESLTLSDFQAWRWNTGHLLPATALLAVMLTAVITLGTFLGPFALGCAALGLGWYVVLRKERQRAAARQQRAQRLKSRIAARRASVDGQPLPEASDSATGHAADHAADHDAPVRPQLTFSFSLPQLLGTFATAALILGLARGLGGPAQAALLLGGIAVVGLAVYLLGVEVAPLLVFGWWVLLVLYILVSLVAVASGDSTSQTAREEYVCYNSSRSTTVCNN